MIFYKLKLYSHFDTINSYLHNITLNFLTFSRLLNYSIGKPITLIILWKLHAHNSIAHSSVLLGRLVCFRLSGEIWLFTSHWLISIIICLFYSWYLLLNHCLACLFWRNCLKIIKFVWFFFVFSHSFCCFIF